MAAQRVVDLLVEYGGGTADDATSDLNEVVASNPIPMKLSEPLRLTGVDYGDDRIIELLEMIGCEVSRDGEMLSVQAPTWRVGRRAI